MKQQPIIETQKTKQHSTMVEPSGLAYCMVGCMRQVYISLRRLVSIVSLNPAWHCLKKKILKNHTLHKAVMML